MPQKTFSYNIEVQNVIKNILIHFSDFSRFFKFYSIYGSTFFTLKHNLLKMAWLQAENY